MTDPEQVPDWDTAEWTGVPLPDRVRDRYPQLVHIAAVTLDSPLLAGHNASHEQRLVTGWIRGRGQCERVADLLDLRDEAILAWPQIGTGKRDQINAWLAGVDADVPNILSGPATVVDAYVPAADPDLEVIARWGVFVGSAATWGEAEVHLARGLVPDDVALALSRLRARTLPPMQPEEDADTILAAWVESLDERTRAILRGRLVRAPLRTLEVIGQEHGVTRERIRQLERKLQDKIPVLLAQVAWRPVRWEVFAVQRRFGSYAPLSDDETAYLSSADGFARSLVVWLAGYDRGEDRVRARGFGLPKVGELPTLPDLPIIDEAAVHADLLAAGVSPALLGWTIDSVKGVARVDGQGVLWPNNIVDKSYAVLAVRDKQMTADELAEAIGGGVSVRGLRARLYDDPRLCRVTRTHVGLVAWGGEAYTSLVDLMCSRLESGPRLLADLSAELAAEFDASENSVTWYAAAPVFHVDQGMVSLRTAEHPYVPRATPQAVSTLYRTGADELVWSVTVDHDLLRGSGRSLAGEIATFLGMEPGVRTTLRNAVRDVPVNWLQTSHVGPHLGSLKPHVEALGAADGDVVLLRVDRAAHTLSISLRPPAPTELSVAGRLAWLTGAPTYVCSDAVALASAASTTPEHLVTVLQQRGEPLAAELASTLLAGDPAEDFQP